MNATVSLTVLYNHPVDPDAFESYYRDVHLPIVAAHAAEIGFARAELVKFSTAIDGTPPTLYRKAELWFDSEEALSRGLATAGFQKVAGDLASFATGGFTALLAVRTGP